MKKESFSGTMIGKRIPPSIAHIEWVQVGNSNQYAGEDSLSNEWRKEESSDQHIFWTTLFSQYREAVCLPLTICTDKSMIVTAIELEAYVSYGPCHGRPEYTLPQVREDRQVDKMLRELSNKGS